MNQTLIFKISQILNQNLGASEVYSFEGPVDFEDINVSSDLSGKVEMMKTDKGISATISECEIETDLKCEKCLEDFKFKVYIESSEREFLLKEPELVEDPNDLFLIKKKKLEIDLSNMIRQEIILHFPTIKVCSKSCKGICCKCGTDNNKKACDCTKEERPGKNKPLAILKDLIQ